MNSRELRAQEIRGDLARKAITTGDLQPWEGLLQVVAPGVDLLKLTLGMAEAEEGSAPSPFPCAHCGELFLPKDSRTKHCSISCGMKTFHKQQRINGKRCRKGHLRTLENTRPRQDGSIRCLDCQRKQDLQRSPSRKAARNRWYTKHKEIHIARASERRRQRRAAERKPLTEKQWTWAKSYICPPGHERTRENTIIDKRGARRCLECRNGARARKLVATDTPEPWRTSSISSGEGGKP